MKGDVVQPPANDRFHLESKVGDDDDRDDVSGTIVVQICHSSVLTGLKVMGRADPVIGQVFVSLRYWVGKLGY